MFSYIGAALQENVSGWLIDQNSQLVDVAHLYDFAPATRFCIGSSAAALSRAKLCD